MPELIGGGYLQRIKDWELLIARGHYATVAGRAGYRNPLFATLCVYFANEIHMFDSNILGGM